MTTLLHEPAAGRQTRPVERPSEYTALLPSPSHQAPGRPLRDRLLTAGKTTLECALFALVLPILYLLFGSVVLAIALGPFLLPLLGLPLVLLFGLVIVGAGKVLAALGAL